MLWNLHECLSEVMNFLTKYMLLPLSSKIADIYLQMKILKIIIFSSSNSIRTIDFYELK